MAVRIRLVRGVPEAVCDTPSEAVDFFRRVSSNGSVVPSEPRRRGRPAKNGRPAHEIKAAEDIDIALAIAIAIQEGNKIGNGASSDDLLSTTRAKNAKALGPVMARFNRVIENHGFKPTSIYQKCPTASGNRWAGYSKLEELIAKLEMEKAKQK